MKKLLALLLALVMVLSFAACNNEPVNDQSESESQSETENNENNEVEEPAAATYTLGMGVSVSTASSAQGNAQVDATVATVVLDAEGKIVAADLDVAQTKMNITDGVANTEIDARTKKEKKEDYGMAAVMGVPEWYIQAQAFCDYVIGLTADEVANIATVENDHGYVVAADETLYAGCTIQVTDFIDAFTKACNDEYAREFTADEFKLGLSAITTADASCADATAEADGAANMYTEFAAVVVDGEGKLLAALIDSIQPKISFNTAGEITAAEFKGTKKELKEDYGMAAIMGVPEWYIQATAFEDFIIGMTGDEVSSIATTENDHGYVVAADETLYAGCTIQIADYMESVAKAAVNAQ